MENTDAESVDDMTEASNKASVRLRERFRSVRPQIQKTNTPVINAVVKTPKVANTTPSPIIGRISFILVSIPPEKRMMLNATIPIN